MAETPIDTERILRLGTLAADALAEEEPWMVWFKLLFMTWTDGRFTFEVGVPRSDWDERESKAQELLVTRTVRAALLAWYAFGTTQSIVDPAQEYDPEDDEDVRTAVATMLYDTVHITDPVSRVARLLAFAVADAEAELERERAGLAGAEDGAAADDEWEPPSDFEERLNRAATAALDVYYAPVTTA